jgi:2-iminobutanoate/2-iminopropanoate deaminase
LIDGWQKLTYTRRRTARGWHAQAMVDAMSENGIRAFTFTPDDGVPPAVAPFAHATAAGPTLYVTGQMPTDITGAVVGGDVATQTDQVLRNLLRVTELCGGTLADVVSVRAYLIDWDDYDAFNAAYAAWFPDRLPSRTCVGVTGLAVGARVEIDWVCWRSEGWGATMDV